MESGTGGRAEGTPHQLRSKVKEVAGMISDCPNREAEGGAGRMAGKARVRIGQFNQFWSK